VSRSPGTSNRIAYRIKLSGFSSQHMLLKRHVAVVSRDAL
jgi:hypothetical protein